jgi:uncharacterized membrane protein YedE/YeeE
MFVRLGLRSPLVSGVLTTSRQVGGALGVAVMGVIVAAAEIVPQTDPRFPLQFVRGFQHALETGAVIALAGALLSAILARREQVAKPRPVAPHSRSRGRSSDYDVGATTA